jgi:hypothetical protein
MVEALFWTCALVGALCLILAPAAWVADWLAKR